MHAPEAALSSERRELENLLQSSHDTRVFEVLQQFASRLKKRRQAFFNASGALLSLPIDCQAARQRGVWPDSEDNFTLLQGDIVFTGAVYFMGNRLEQGYFALANATCDLVTDRRKYVLLLPVRAVYAPSPAEESAVRSLLRELLSFKSARRMYLPPLPGDEISIIARFIDFDGVAQADTADIALAERVASLSLVGWRIFGVHLRRILTRAGESEIALRSAA